MAAETPGPLLFGVAGDPVAHSLSPRMHAAAYRELGIDAVYQRLPIPSELFDETVRALPASGFRGINVTVPHKVAAWALADRRSDAVRAIGAANTLTFVEGEIHAENTDAGGLLAALDGSVDGSRALVLGAGGTARAAIWALRNAGAEVDVFNRTRARAEGLADELGATAVASTGGGGGYDVILNTTTVGMDSAVGEVDALAAFQLDLTRVGEATKVVDFVYREDTSPLAAAASRFGLTVVDGRELLLQQGAKSFELWFDRPAPVAVMRQSLTT